MTEDLGRDDAGRSLERLSASSRVEAFSDGVLAIAVTLLVLDLKVPDDAGWHALVRQWPAYVAYLASFAYIGVIWVNHHYLFTRIRVVDSGLLWRNLVLLFAASSLPFPTAVVSSSFQRGSDASRTSGLVLYASVAALAVASWLALFHHLSGHPELLRHSAHALFFAAERGRAWLGLIVYAICAGVAFVSPIAALVLALLVPGFYAVTSRGAVSAAASIGAVGED
jgi:uncharacterized membrane protein